MNINNQLDIKYPLSYLNFSNFNRELDKMGGNLKRIIKYQMVQYKKNI